MRNSTKLKLLLQRYSINLNMDDGELFVLMLSDKRTNNAVMFEDKSYSAVLQKAYSHMLKQIKRETVI